MRRVLTACLAAAAVVVGACAPPAAPAPTSIPPSPTSPPSPTATALPSTPAAEPTRAAAAGRVQPLSPRARVILDISSDNIASLPLFYALDKGSFDQAGLDVEVQQFRGGGGRELPRLGRGDVDVLPAISPQPGLFNLLKDGFEVKIVGSCWG